MIINKIYASWFIFAILSTLIYGIMNFLYKIAASKGCKSSRIINKAAFFVALLSFMFCFIKDSKFDNFWYILLFALINSSFFGLGAVSKITALKFIPTSYVFPITKLNSVFVIILSVIFFKERPKLIQWIGLIFSFTMIIFIFMDSRIEKNKLLMTNRGLFLSIVSAIATAFSMLTGKIAVSHVPKLNYMFLSYTLVFLYTLLLNNIRKESATPNSECTASLTISKNFSQDIYLGRRKKFIQFLISRKKEFFYGSMIGILNFIGYLLILMAFSRGPLSLIQGIFSTSMIIPITASVVFLNEDFTLKKGLIVVLSLIAVILIKL